MRVVVGNLWDFYKNEKGYVVVPINWTCTGYGEAVMGGGVAQQAAQLLPGLPSAIARYIMGQPMVPQFVTYADLFLLPVKKHWRDSTDIALMEQSLRQLAEHCSYPGSDCCYLPLLGAGFDGLKVMARTLTTDKFVLVLKDPSR